MEIGSAMDFTHLHVHTEYSLLDGFSKIPKLIERTKELGMSAVAISDHGTMFGVIDFYNTAIKNEIKPIIGVEMYLSPRSMEQKDPKYDRKPFHSLLLAENQTGYQNLLKIASTAQLKGYYYKPRVDHEYLAAHSEGIICTSACLGGDIPRAIMEDNEPLARERLQWYLDVFGRERFFLEVQGHQISELQRVNKVLFEFAKEYDVDVVATSDVHYVNKEDAKIHDIMLCLQTNKLLSDEDRMKMTPQSFFLHSPQQISDMFPDHPEVLTNTMKIAERCEVDLAPKGYHLPKFDVEPEYEDPQAYEEIRLDTERVTNEKMKKKQLGNIGPDSVYLRKLCWEGLKDRCQDKADDPRYVQQLEYELGVITSMGFDSYFLIVWDLCKKCSELGIWYTTRGSAAGSILAYTLNITHVDPLEYKLIFERFLNKDRISMPDIDLDIQDDKRHIIMEYCAEKYGEEMVAAIITFGKMKARGAIRDVGRVQGVPLPEVDRIAKLIPGGPKAKISSALEEVEDLKNEYKNNLVVKNLIDYALQIEGTLRNAGTHAAGVLVTDVPVVNYTPLHRPTSNSDDVPIKAVSQFDMVTVDSLGLLKVDFLGLSTLTIMQRCADLVRERHGVDINMSNIPIDDPVVYEMLSSGSTAGIFQVEGAGMTRWITEMQPHTIENIIAMIALYRPGPLDFIPEYIACMHGEKEIQYRHPMLEPILKDTYGVHVYQEQIMATAIQLGGYTPGEADILRKIVAKKKVKQLPAQRKKFINGASENGIEKSVAEAIFIDWEAFANYGFNKGHAAAYALLVMQTAYMKCYYPEEYMSALLSVYIDDKEKVAFYIGDCRKLGIELLPPSVLSSEWDFTIEAIEDEEAENGVRHGIRFGLGAIKNVGRNSVEEIMEARSKNSIDSLNDFTKNVNLKKVGKRALEYLTKAGAMEHYGPRKSVLAKVEEMASVSNSYWQAKESGQMMLFGADTGLEANIYLPDTSAQYNQREELDWEKELIGLYVSDHPVATVLGDLKNVISHDSSTVHLARDNSKVIVAGIINSVRYITTKNMKEMAFINIEDVNGVLKLVFFPNVWKKFKDEVDYNKIVLIYGQVQSRNDEINIIVDKMVDKVRYFEMSDMEKHHFSSSQPYYGKQKTSMQKPMRENAKPQDTYSRKAKPQNAAETGAVFVPEKKEEISTPLPPKNEKPVIEKQEVPVKKIDQAIPQNADMPPEPEAFPDQWMDDAEMFFDDANDGSQAGAQIGEPEVSPSIVAAPANESVEKLALPSVDTVESIQEEASESMILTVEVEEGESRENQPAQNVIKETKEKYVVPAAVEMQVATPKADPSASYMLNASFDHRSTEENKKLQKMLRVILRPRGDKSRDFLHIRRIYNILSEYPGNDRFCFYIIEDDKGYLVEYPHIAISVNPDLIQRLEVILGKENVKIEEINIQ